MADEAQIEQGRAVLRRLFGERVSKKADAALASMGSGFYEFSMQGFCLYDRPALDMKTRSAITIGILTAMGRSDELVVHVRGGLNQGLTEEQIREIILQAALYAGAPVALGANLIANKIFEKVRAEQAAQP